MDLHSFNISPLMRINQNFILQIVSMFSNHNNTYSKLNNFIITVWGGRIVGYLKCKSCGGCYKLQPGELPGHFESCSCGGELEFYDDRGRKRGYKKYYSGTETPKTHPLIKIIVMVVGGLLLFGFVGGLIIVGLLFVLEYVGPSNGTYVFMLFFGILIAIIVGLMWFVFRRRNPNAENEDEYENDELSEE